MKKKNLDPQKMSKSVFPYMREKCNGNQPKRKAESKKIRTVMTNYREYQANLGAWTNTIQFLT